MPRKSIFILIFLFAVGLVSAQNATDKPKDEEKEKLRKATVEFLRETMVEVNGMRSLENRLSFSAELASLMWFHDEKEARAMYQGVTTDFRTLLFEFDRQLNLIEAAKTDEDLEEDFSPGSLFTGASEKYAIERKLQTALEIRQQIAMSLAEHEPDMALAFFNDSITAITNKDFRARADERDAGFQMQLMTQIAETNAAKAAQFAGKSLEKGFNYQHLELLKKIYAKDADKGIEFAQAVINRFKSSKFDGSELWTLNQLIEFGDSTNPKKDGKKPVMTPSELRDLTEILAAAVLADKTDDGITDPGTLYMSTFEKHTPTRAAQIKAKYRTQIAAAGRAANAANTAAMAMANGANAMANAANAGPDPAAERRAKALEERLEAERKLMEQVSGMSTKNLPKEERDKIVEQARKMIAKTGGKDKKILGLSALAAQVSKAGDKELAAQIMNDAESLVVSQPKNYQDYLMTWMLISGYAEADPAKAFPKLNDTIFRLNGTIEAFVKAAEFIDPRGEMVDDGEVQVGQFGGSMLRGLTRELKIAEPTLRSLAKADFSKTKAATNAFDRPEVRVLAKMLVIRTILDEKSEEKTVSLDDAPAILL